MEHLAVAENLLREEVVDAAVGVLVADGGQRVLLPGEGVLGVVVDHRAAVQHRREDALAVAVVVQLVQLGVDEDRQAAHREQLLGFEKARQTDFAQLQRVGGGVLVVLREQVRRPQEGQRAAPPHRVVLLDVLVREQIHALPCADQLDTLPRNPR